MYRYLTTKTADYTTTMLEIPSQVTLSQSGNKSQVSHDFDDGSLAVVGLSSSSYFDVQLQWNYITECNKDIILDLWHNPLKADGMRRTFYWKHPKTLKYYTVQFTSPLVVDDVPAAMGIQTVSLRISGNKPA